MTTTLPDVDLGVDLDAEVPCTFFGEDCPNPASWLSLARHDDDGTPCSPDGCCSGCYRSAMSPWRLLGDWVCGDHDRNVTLTWRAL